MRRARPWFAALLLVTVGWLVSPSPVPVYDGVGVPDEPYRYVAPPAGLKATPDPTVATAVTPVKDGLLSRGVIVTTAEQSPQFTLFVPGGALAAKAGQITVTGTPVAPTGPPPFGKAYGGNAYRVTFTDPAGPVTSTPLLASASLNMRAPDTSTGWVMHYRADDGAKWQVRQTSRSGTDSFVSPFAGAGEYVLAEVPRAEGKDGGVSVLPLALGGGLLLLVVLVVVIRLRAAPEGDSGPDGERMA